MMAIGAMSDLAAVLVWWLIVQLMGLAALPLAFRLLRWLPDRGYAFSKAMGVLLVSFLLWSLTSLGFLRNSSGGILLAAAMLVLFSAWIYRRGDRPAEVGEGLWTWLKEHQGYVLAAELLFAVAFGLWACVRAYSPEIIGTEKPMDLAFINAVSRSEVFPPLDPWLSGYAISYYYFGYLIISTLARLATVPGEVAFNLGQAWLFAGTLLGGFGLVANLVTAGRRDGAALGRSIGSGLVGGLLVTVMGNLEGLLEVLHVNAVLPGAFWRWLDIKEINVVPPEMGMWPPRPGWWWWRASRVIHDKDLFGNDLEVIDEFPFFSFLLGDMHPHVLALPFVFLALALALNWWLKQWEPDGEGENTLWGWARAFLREADPAFLGVYAVCLGALGFLNTWDFPIYLFVTVGALALAQMRAGRALDSGFIIEASLSSLAALASLVLFLRGRLQGAGYSWLAIAVMLGLLAAGLASLARRRRLETGRMVPGLIGQVLLVGCGLLAAGVIFYLPFYIGLRSQAGGLLPNIINPSRVSQYLVMFGPFLLLLIPWMMALARRTEFPTRTFLVVTGGVFGALLLAAAVFSAAALANPTAYAWVDSVVQGLGSVGAALQRILAIRLTHSWTTLFLLAIIGWVVALWQSRLNPGAAVTLSGEGSVSPYVLLLVLTAALLTLGPEFVYLKDNFGTRMNTIFKFYYQAWVMYAVASAYALWAMGSAGGWLRWGARGGAVLLIAAGLIYPALSLLTRTNHFRGEATLDGMAYMATAQPADYGMIQWFQENVSGTPVILEAVGGQYSSGGRVSVHTGLPTVLGWAGHELQWRGATPEPTIRESDIEKMYTSHVWSETQALLDKYDIEYVVVGPLEVNTYGQVAATKFERTLELVFQGEGARVYRWNSLK
jgi:YYY domain-containing protein